MLRYAAVLCSFIFVSLIWFLIWKSRSRLVSIDDPWDYWSSKISGLTNQRNNHIPIPNRLPLSSENNEKGFSRTTDPDMGNPMLVTDMQIETKLLVGQVPREAEAERVFIESKIQKNRNAPD